MLYALKEWSELHECKVVQLGEQLQVLPIVVNSLKPHHDFADEVDQELFDMRFLLV